MNRLLVRLTDAEQADPIGSILELEVDERFILDARLHLDRGHDTFGLRKCIGRDVSHLIREMRAGRTRIEVYNGAWVGIDVLDEPGKDAIELLMKWSADSGATRMWARYSAVRDHLRDMLSLLKRQPALIADIERSVNDLIMLLREARSDTAIVRDLYALEMVVSAEVGLACGELAAKHDKMFRLI